MIYNFLTNLLGPYVPIMVQRTDYMQEAVVNWGWIFDAIAVLGFSFLIFKIILLIVKGVFFR